MSAELQPRQSNLPTIEPPSESVALMQIIERAATDKDMDVAKLEKLLDLKRQWDADQARKSFSAAMADFQANCPTVFKSKQADRYTYAPLDTILRTIRPHLEAAGLSVRFTTRMDEGTVTAVCTVAHRDGYSETSEFTAPIDRNMKVNSTQQVGSANTYAKRYALSNALNLVGSELDDDGKYAAKEPNPDDEPATDEQIIRIQEYRDEGQIPEVTLKWLDKQDPLTVGQAKTLLAKLRKAEREDRKEKAGAK